MVQVVAGEGLQLHLECDLPPLRVEAGPTEVRLGGLAEQAELGFPHEPEALEGLRQRLSLAYRAGGPLLLRKGGLPRSSVRVRPLTSIQEAGSIGQR